MQRKLRFRKIAVLFLSLTLSSVALLSVTALLSCKEQGSGSDTGGSGGENTIPPVPPAPPPVPQLSTAIAVGGVVSFIDNGDGTWDELHTFFYDAANDVNGQTVENLTFQTVPDLMASTLIVAGGGGGGWSDANRVSGGGGAGGLIYETAVSLSGGTDFEVKVGRGGTPGTGASVEGESQNGIDSQFLSHIAVGGGGGGGHSGYYSSTGHTGGSGGGYNNYQTAAPGAGTPGQGNAGAVHAGGGAGTAATAEKGGKGREIDITGTAEWYAGGGGNSAGGDGGGGAGGQSGENGKGGGGGANISGAGATRGGDGIVIIRFPWTAP